MLLSASKDHGLRLWNVKTGHNVAIFGGMEGHRDEVISADFNFAGTRIVSSGMDHSIKIWRCDTEELVAAIALSSTHDTDTTGRTFPSCVWPAPIFSSRDIHRNYVDCCRWLGDFVLSKSCENSLVCWRPGKLGGAQEEEEGVTVRLLESSSFTTILSLESPHTELWFMRFSLDSTEQWLALGDQRGQVICNSRVKSFI